MYFHTPHIDLCKVEPYAVDCELQPKIQPHIIPTHCISYAFKQLGHKKWPVNVFGHFENITQVRKNVNRAIASVVIMMMMMIAIRRRENICWLVGQGSLLSFNFASLADTRMHISNLTAEGCG